MDKKLDIFPPDPDVAMVTVIPEINTIEVTDPTTGEQISRAELTRYRHAQLLAGILCRVYLPLGPGEHTISEITSSTDVHSNSAYHHGKTLADILPEHVYQFRESTRNDTTLRFGNLAITGRHATPDEITEYTARQQTNRDNTLEQERERLLAEEGSKVDLTGYDYALIHVEARAYQLPTESPESIMAVRVMQAIANTDPAHLYFPLNIAAISRLAWSLMPIAERSLFVSTERKIFGPASNIERQVSAILHSPLAYQTGIVRRGQTVRRTVLNTTDVSMSLHLSPPETPYGPEVTPIFPPGTPIEEVRGKTTASIAAEDMETARQALDYSRESGGWRLHHADAIAILDLVMTRPGKVALREALQQLGRETPLETALEKIHQRLRSSLGNDAYWDARRNRTIAGNHFTNKKRRAQQVGGALPGTTKWHVGIKDGA